MRMRKVIFWALRFHAAGGGRKIGPMDEALSNAMGD
jgi:hypothetical protein